MNLKGNKGISLISLIITVIILLMVTSAIIFNTKNQFNIRQINSLKNDINELSNRVEDYYLKYGELPILCKYTDKNYPKLKDKEDFQEQIYLNAQEKGADVNNDISEADGNDYGVIDLEKLENLSLNFGYDKDYFDIKNGDKQINIENPEDEIYVINLLSHQIYFPHGIFVDNVMYYSGDTDKYHITTETSINIKASDTKNKNKEYYEKLYGSIVNYSKTISTSLENKWKILYSDGNNFYLISDGYIQIPEGTYYSFIRVDDDKAKFTSTGADGIIPKYTNGIGSINAEIVKKWNNDFFNVNKLTGNGQSNMKALASMTDTSDNSYWKSFTDNSTAEYTIGGPTIEMLFDSYNQTHGTNYGAKAFPKSANGVQADGYKINVERKTEDSNPNWTTLINAIFSQDTNKLYISEKDVINQTTNEPVNPSGYWLASPSTLAEDTMMCCYNSGKIDGHATISSNNIGFRPIVCLKSNVKLKQLQDGSYDIVD